MLKKLKDLFPDLVFDKDGNPDPFGANGAIEVADSATPFVPPSDPNRVFVKDTLREIISFLAKPHGDALYITGPTGSGKTSLVTEVAARFGREVFSVTCNSRFEFQSLVGEFRLEADHPGATPSMKFQKGPLPLAMERGAILLLNEIDLADAGEVAGLNDVLEGRPLVISQNGGEIVLPDPNFRFIATGNSAGGGDETGRYEGVKTMNLAFMDRFRMMTVGYAPAKVEQELLAKAVPYVKGFAPQMVQLANHIRHTFEVGECSVTMSTRNLLRWARLAQDYRRAQCPLKEALRLALLSRTPKHEADSINEQCQMIFGQENWPRD